MPRPLLLVAMFLAVATVAPVTTLAQDATPTPEFVTPDPVECRVAPRSPESIAVALASPSAGTPASATSASAIPSGEPADAKTEEQVMELARQATACGNAGDYRRVFALYTDNGLRVFAADRGLTPEQLLGPLAATPVPLPADAWQGVRLREVRRLPDGRVSAFIDFSAPQGIGTVFVVLVREDDRFLVDAELAVPAALATPNP